MVNRSSSKSSKSKAATLAHPASSSTRHQKARRRRARLKLWLRARRHWRRLWNRNSGEWSWLASRPIPLAGLSRKVWRIAEPSFNYFVMLFLAGVIATLGLLANSSATIIGAMIVAPLMGPIVGVAFAMVLGNQRLLKRSILGIATGALMTVLTAWAMAWLMGFASLNPEISARVRPSLIDLAVALAAGAAAAYANTHRDIADSLPGVAISVALVPPLSVMGIGMAMGSYSITGGAALLFLTNLASMIFSGALVFIWQEYGSLKRAQSGLTMAVVTLLILGLPLSLSLRELIIEKRTRKSLYSLIQHRTVTFEKADIQSLNVALDSQNLLRVKLDVAASEQSISSTQVELVRQFIEAELDRSIALEVNVFPVQSFSSNPPISTPLGRKK